MAPEPKYSSRGGVNSYVWWGVGVAILLMFFGAGGYWYFFIHSNQPVQPQTPQTGASAVPKVDQCVGKVEKKLQNNLVEPDKTSGKTKFALDQETEERLKNELTDPDTRGCLEQHRPKLWAILSAVTGQTFTERLASANEQGLIKWDSEKKMWTLPLTADPRPNPPAKTVSAPSTPDDPCVASVEEVFVKVGLTVDQQNLRVKISEINFDGPVKEILQAQGDCLEKFRPDFVRALGPERDPASHASPPSWVRARLTHAAEAKLLVMVGAKPRIGPIPTTQTSDKSTPGGTGNVDLRQQEQQNPQIVEPTKPPEKSAAPSPATVEKSTPHVEADKLNAEGASPSTSTLVLIGLVILLFVVEAARLWLEWINGGNPLTRTSRLSHLPDVRSSHVNWDDDQSAGRKLAMNYSRDEASSTQIALNRALLDTLRKLQDGQTRQEKALEELVRLQRLIAQGGRAGTDPSNVNDVTGGSGLAIPGRIETSSGQSRQSSALVLGQDPFEDYQRLEKALFLPEEQRRFFRERWQVQPVVQISEAGKYFLGPANTEDEAVMWILMKVKDSRGSPVVLAPLAYEPRMAESNSRTLLTATNGFFKSSSQNGARAAVEHPALVRREGQLEVFTCIEKGVLRA